MPQIRQQQGSSTAGLLTASAIFIALLVYANQYAFEDSTAQAGGAVEEDAATVTLSGVGTGEQPVAAGETGAGDALFNPSSQTAIVDHKAAEAAEAGSGGPVKPFQSVTAVTAQAGYGFIPASYPVATYGYPGDRYQSDFNGANLQNIGAYQSLNNDLDGRGRGRGRGTANGDGEFDFSMKFKSRARFDADTELDGDWLGEGNGIYYGNYYQDTAYYPSYSYGYYRY